MKVPVCENNSSGTSSPFMVTDCLEKFFTGINVADSVSEKITQEEQSSLRRRPVVWRNYSEQMTEKQNIVETSTKSPKKETPPYMEIGVASTEKGKVFHIKQEWIG